MLFWMRNNLVICYSAKRVKFLSGGRTCTRRAYVYGKPENLWG